MRTLGLEGLHFGQEHRPYSFLVWKAFLGKDTLYRKPWLLFLWEDPRGPGYARREIEDHLRSKAARGEAHIGVPFVAVLEYRAPICLQSLYVCHDLMDLPLYPLCPTDETARASSETDNEDLFDVMARRLIYEEKDWRTTETSSVFMLDV